VIQQQIKHLQDIGLARCGKGDKMAKKPARKPINAKTKKALQAKAAKSKYTYGQLAQVYRRGQGAYLSSGSKSASMAAWAMGRVNSFIRGGHSQDNDIKRKKK